MLGKTQGRADNCYGRARDGPEAQSYRRYFVAPSLIAEWAIRGKSEGDRQIGIYEDNLGPIQTCLYDPLERYACPNIGGLRIKGQIFSCRDDPQ